MDARAGFSLTEVVLALGVISFALIPMVCLLPAGLSTIQASMDQTVMANIRQQIRGELQEISFDSLTTLSQSPYYYTAEGEQTTDSDPNAYYAITFKINPAPIPGSGSGEDFDSQNAAQTVIVTATYPQSAPQASRKSAVFSFLAAKQGSN